MRDAMAPVCLSVGWWQEQAAAGERVELPVVVVNDTAAAWAGDVRVAVVRDARTLHAESKPLRVEPVGRGELSFSATLPAAAGEVEVVASLRGPDGRSVRSVRAVKVGGAGPPMPSVDAAPAVAETPEQQKAKTINSATGTGKRE